MPRRKERAGHPAELTERAKNRFGPPPARAPRGMKRGTGALADPGERKAWRRRPAWFPPPQGLEPTQ